MRIALISPANSKFIVKQSKFKLQKFHIIRAGRIGLLSIAAATPPGHDVKIIDEQYDSINYSEKFDLIGISFSTDTAPRAYEIGDRFKDIGVKVVFGGFHPTLMPDEAIEHCDSVCIGEGEVNWPIIVRDTDKNRLKRFYRNPTPIDLANMKRLPRHLVRKRDFFSSYLVFAGRGCINTCEFCSVTHFFNFSYRHRKIEEIISEITSMKKNIIIFGDDNIIADRDFALDLFKTLKQIKKKWVAQALITIGEDEELLKMASESGCIGLFIGLETLSDKNLSNSGKNLMSVDRYKDSLEKIYNYGIAVLGSFIFGFDDDKPDVFEKTLNFAIQNRLIASQIAILTPFPGTSLYRKLDETGRIINKDWSRYDFKNVVFKPKHLSPEELKEGTDWVIGEYYSNSSILKRLGGFLKYWGFKNTLLYALPFNIAYRQYFKREKE
jgi:radical SAM superfamily enzyme YgiQ (UPF0313 family)